MVFDNTNYITTFTGQDKGILAPKGSIILMPMPIVVFDPPGYLRCDGRTVNIADYLDLYEVIGTSFGGNGTTTFVIPDMQSNFLYGKTNASNQMNQTIGVNETKLTVAKLPYHRHTLTTLDHKHTGFESQRENQVKNDDFNNSNNGNGPSIVGGGRQAIGTGYGIGLESANASISISNAGQSSPSNFPTVPQYMEMVYLIKY